MMSETFRNISGFGRVGVKLIGMDRLSSTIQRVVSKNSNNKNVFNIIGQKMRAIILDNFTLQENPDGSEWPELSERTIRERRQGLGSGVPQMLRDTGVLFNSISYQAYENEAVAGTNVHYARDHIYGEKEHNIPIRNFMWLGRDDMKELNDLLTHELIINAFKGI